MNNIRYDLDLKILQNILKLSLYYNNLSNTKLISIIRFYLLSEYQQNNKVLTNYKLITDIIHSTDEQILELINKCKQKIKLILSGTVGLSKPLFGFEWIAVAVNTTNNRKWIEMTLNVFPDRQWNDDNDASLNKYQFHMFITRNFQFSIHQWLYGKRTTPKLSLWLHTAAKIGLNAQYIVSRPIARMKSIMKHAGFEEIESHQIYKIIEKIGKQNYNCFQQVQSVNDWLVSPKTFDVHFSLKRRSVCK